MSFAEFSESDSIDFGYRRLIGLRLDQYVVESYIAGGAYGYVFRGRDTALDRPVAIKFGREGTRFKDLAGEAKRIARLDDLKENVVQVFGFGTYDVWPYLVMEFLPGESLESIWEKQNRRLDGGLVREFVKQIGTALHAAHARGFVHRDLKPSNIQVVPRGIDPQTGTESYRFVLLDFGISAKVNEASKTMQNLTLRQMGTFAYMSPEHLHGKEQPGQESLGDVYAFGVILYQLLTGVVPYAVKETQSIAAMHVETINAKKHRPPAFHKVAPELELPSGVERVVRRCLEINPQHRPQTMGEVVREFLAAWPEPKSPSVERPRTRMTALLSIPVVLLAAAAVGHSLGWFSPAPIPQQNEERPSPPPAGIWLVSRDAMMLPPVVPDGDVFEIKASGDQFRHDDWSIGGVSGLQITPEDGPEQTLRWRIAVSDPDSAGSRQTVQITAKNARLESVTRTIDVQIRRLDEKLIEPEFVAEPPAAPARFWTILNSKLDLAPEDGAGATFAITYDSDGETFRHEDWDVNPPEDGGIDISPANADGSTLSWRIVVVEPNLTGRQIIEVTPKHEALKQELQLVDLRIKPRLEFSLPMPPTGVTRTPYLGVKRIGRWQLPDVVTIEVLSPDQKKTVAVRLHLIECTPQAIEAAQQTLAEVNLVQSTSRPKPLGAAAFPRQSFYVSEELVNWSLFYSFIAANSDEVADYYWRPARKDGDGAFIFLDPELTGDIQLEPGDEPYAEYVKRMAATHPHEPAVNLLPWMAARCCQWIAGPDATLPSAAEWDWICGFTNRQPVGTGFPKPGPIKELKKSGGLSEILRTIDSDEDDPVEGLPTEKETRKVLLDPLGGGDRHLKLRDGNHATFPKTYEEWDVDNASLNSIAQSSPHFVFRIAIPLEKLFAEQDSPPAGE